MAMKHYEREGSAHLNGESRNRAGPGRLTTRSRKEDETCKLGRKNESKRESGLR